MRGASGAHTPQDPDHWSTHAYAPAPASHHVVPTGKLVGTRFMSVFRFKVWWTTHWVGTASRDVENETQMMVLHRSADRHYVLLLPIVDDAFRASLQSGEDDHVALCLESGSSAVNGSCSVAPCTCTPTTNRSSWSGRRPGWCAPTSAPQGEG